MVRISASAQKCLKGLHLAAVGCWIGGGVSLIMFHFLRPGTGGDGVLNGINQAAHGVDGAYLHNAQMNFIWGTVQVAVLVAIVFISVFKPWKNFGKRNG